MAESELLKELRKLEERLKQIKHELDKLQQQIKEMLKKK